MSSAPGHGVSRARRLQTDRASATTANQFSGVGNYPVTMTLASNPNYMIMTGE